MDYKTLNCRKLSFKTITAPGMVGHILKKDCIQSLEMEINDNTAALQKLSISINRSALNQINEIKKYIILSNPMLLVLYIIN
jgi:hypothetical protein